MRQYYAALMMAFAAALPDACRAESLPTPPPGWTLEVVARSPKVRHPSVVCCAPDGRVFVAEDPMDIRLPSADAKQGRILCIHPDGRITTFAQDLYAVFGMQYLDGQLYVLHNPKFTVFNDDGSGVGTDRRDLVECTNPNPWALNWNDHVPANFRLAMDGYFYVAVGDKGVYGAVGTDGRRVDQRGGGILRLRPDGSGLEVFCTGVRNILDVAINEDDELFTYDNTDEHDWMGRLTHMVDSGFYGYPYDFVPRRPYTLWMMADYGAGAATGAACYVDDTLPPEYHGNLFLADFGKRNILRVRVERDGATFKAVSRQDLFTDVPADFRPVGICFSPDGAAQYICDWQHVDTKEDVEVGRLLKLKYAGPPGGRKRPEWFVAAASGRPFEAGDEELIQALEHPSHGVRLTAQRRLADRGAQAVAPLKALLKSATAQARSRVHALWALDAIDGGALAADEIVLTGADGDVGLRRQAVRQLGSLRTVEAMAAVLLRLADEDASVRFHAASTCGRIAKPTDASEAIPALRRALIDEDTWVRYAASTAMNRIGRRHPQAWSLIAAGLTSDDPAVRDGTSYALRDTYDRQLVTAVAEIANRRENTLATRTAAAAVLGPLHRRISAWKGEWWAYHPALGAPPQKTEAWEGTEAVLDVLRRMLDSRDRELHLAGLAGLEQAGDARDAEAVLMRFVGDSDAAVRRAALAALRKCDDGRSGQTLLKYVRRADRDRTLDGDVIRTLGRLKTTEAAPLFVESAREPGLRGAAFEALLALGGEALKAVLELLRDPSVDVRLAAIRTAGEMGNRGAVPALLEAYAARESRDAAAMALARLPDARACKVYIEGLTSTDFVHRERCKASLSEVRNAALPGVEDAARGPLSDEAVLELQQIYGDHGQAKRGPFFRLVVNRKHPGEYVEFAVNHTGDAKAGATLFGAAQAGGVGCVVCHAVNGTGGTVGPALSGVGAKYSRRDLAESVVYPGKAVREGYQQVVVRTRGGQTYAGPVKAQSPEELTLHEADGTLRRIRKADIAARKDTGASPMPENLHAGLTLQQFADLVSYLESLKADDADAGKERP